MLVKVSELIGPALDWAVAKVEKHQPRCAWMLEKEGFHAWQSYERAWGTPIPLYSSDWAQGGPIIEREEIGTKRRAPCMKGEGWEALGSITAKGAGYRCAIGPTPLIAAMRCLCVSKLGDEVEFPDNFFKG